MSQQSEANLRESHVRRINPSIRLIFSILQKQEIERLENDLQTTKSQLTELENENNQLKQTIQQQEQSLSELKTTQENQYQINQQSEANLRESHV